jgi:hypothetical protein
VEVSGLLYDLGIFKIFDSEDFTAKQKVIEKFKPNPERARLEASFHDQIWLFMSNFSNNNSIKPVSRELVKLILCHFLTEGFPSKASTNSLIHKLLSFLLNVGHSQSIAEEVVNNILERQKDNPKNWDIEKMMTVFKSFMKDSEGASGLANPSLSNYIGAGDGSMRESTFTKKGSVAMERTLRHNGSLHNGWRDSTTKHKYTPELNRNSIIIYRER